MTTNLKIDHKSEKCSREQNVRCNADVPSLDHFAGTKHKSEELVAVTARVELRAVEQGADIVYGDLQKKAVVHDSQSCGEKKTCTV